jgi:hypothetical protein
MEMQGVEPGERKTAEIEDWILGICSGLRVQAGEPSEDRNRKLEGCILGQVVSPA